MMLRAVEVWKRLSDYELVCFRCFEVLETKKFFVQSADFYSFPLKKDREQFLQNQFWELLLAGSPNEKTRQFDSLEAAISAHEAEFSKFMSEIRAQYGDLGVSKEELEELRAKYGPGRSEPGT